MEDALVPLLIFGAPERRRAELTERLLPVTVSGSVGQRLAFTAIVAQQEISNREQKELRMIREAARRFHDEEDLEDHAPTLHRIYAALPEADKATVKFYETPEGLAAEREAQEREEAALGRRG
jgi:hypothetical protein